MSLITHREDCRWVIEDLREIALGALVFLLSFAIATELLYWMVEW